MKSKMSYQPFHLVDLRPWPLIISFSGFNFIIIIILRFNNLLNRFIIIFNLFLLLIGIYQWWRDVNREATFQGFHTFIVTKGLKIGIILFIISEVFFFIRFFWRFFHFFLSPDIEIGILWPPIGINQFNPYGIPLLNTIILLSSGFSLTWSHHRILNNEYNTALYSLILTVILGIYFRILQIFEYIEAPFTIADRAFGSVFFISTGFHGFHVLIGTIFLFFNIIRIILLYFNKTHHFRFEAAAWYWHFVDVVWIFLYSLIYWWIF